MVRISDEVLAREARLRVFLKALKYGLRPDLARLLDGILAEAAELEPVDLVVVLTYIALTLAHVSEEEIRMALHRVVPFPEEAIAGSWLQKFIDQGRAEGKAEGEAKGRAEGKADVLLHQLQKRFGPLSSEIEKKVRSADIDQLDEWIDRFVDARGLTEVFEAPMSH